MKKSTGVGLVYMVYDTRDRLVFSQDSAMRINSQWFTTLYDGPNRPVLTGIITYGGNHGDLANRRYHANCHAFQPKYRYTRGHGTFRKQPIR